MATQFAVYILDVHNITVGITPCRMVQYSITAVTF